MHSLTHPCRARGAFLLAVLLAMPLVCGCYSLLPSNGGAQTTFTPPRETDPADVALPPGYAIDVVAEGFTFASSVVVDDEDRVYVVEAGYAYGPEFGEPRLLRVDPGGTTDVVATGDNPPWTGASFSDGDFYVSQGGHLGRIVRIDMEGTITPLVEDLPSFGDHHTNRPVMGPDGWLYFAQGTATNSGVVGVDNYDFGWLQEFPGFHDVPGADIALTGRNYTTANPLTADPNDTATTGAYVPFGTATTPGQVIQGQVKCTGSVLRVRPNGEDLELVAWGLRNPFGLAFAPDGRLYATDHGYDRRGSRPVFGAGDYLWRIEPGLWYGWPDFAGGRPLEHRRFAEAGNPQPRFLLAEHPNDPPKPAGFLGVHSATSGLDFSRNAAFGHVGQAFIAQLGDMADATGKVLGPVGFKVVRVDVETGVVHDFAVNKGRQNGPGSKLRTRGLERPVDVRFNNDGSILYVMDFGVMTVGENPEPVRGTGVLWRIRRTGGTL